VLCSDELSAGQVSMTTVGMLVLLDTEDIIICFSGNNVGIVNNVKAASQLVVKLVD